jgi:predicted unusual protein kinase regulating ubiquinone biosynthesis (AarF/ABC1/UbiB family)
MEKAFKVPIEDIFYDFVEELVAFSSIAQVFLFKNFPH